VRSASNGRKSAETPFGVALEQEAKNLMKRGANMKINGALACLLMASLFASFCFGNKDKLTLSPEDSAGENCLHRESRKC
jgi:hypothetical protein